MAKISNTHIKEFTGIGIALLVLFAFGIFLYSRFGVWQSKPGSISNQHVRHYEDPDRYFSLDIPNSWQVSHQVGTITTGPDNDHLNGYDVEMFAFMSKPVNYSEPNDANILFVEVWRKGQCLDNYKPNTTLAGMPAYYDGTSMYEINNNTASIRLYEHVPGEKEENFSELESNPGGALMRTIPPTPTTPPHNLIAHNRMILNGIVSTFKPTSTTPASCAKGK